MPLPVLRNKNNEFILNINLLITSIKTSNKKNKFRPVKPVYFIKNQKLPLLVTQKLLNMHPIVK